MVLMRSIVALCFVLLSAAPQAGAWMTDLKQAQDRAYAENRIVLINFTGSDWCGWCIKLKGEVFNTSEFSAFAERHLVLVEVDFPNRTPISAQQRAVNKGLANKYGIQGYPTIVLLNGQGKEVGRMGYLAGGPKNNIAEIRKRTGLSANDTARPGAPAAPPTFGGAKTGPPPKYAQLTLKSISGAGAKRLALINNQTLGAGESGRVRLGEGEVKVRVEEIREKSVVVTVDGKGRKELFLDNL